MDAFEGDDREQLRMATDRGATLRAVVAAQQRHLEVAEVIAGSADRAAAGAAVAALLDVDERHGLAVVDMPWRTLCRQRRDQAVEDLNEIERAAELLQHKITGPT